MRNHNIIISTNPFTLQVYRRTNLLEEGRKQILAADQDILHLIQIRMKTTFMTV